MLSMTARASLLEMRSLMGDFETAVEARIVNSEKMVEHGKSLLHEAILEDAKNPTEENKKRIDYCKEALKIYMGNFETAKGSGKRPTTYLLDTITSYQNNSSAQEALVSMLRFREIFIKNPCQQTVSNYTYPYVKVTPYTDLNDMAFVRDQGISSEEEFLHNVNYVIHRFIYIFWTKAQGGGPF